VDLITVLLVLMELIAKQGLMEGAGPARAGGKDNAY
jgi:hypothetical protein